MGEMSVTCIRGPAHTREQCGVVNSEKHELSCVGNGMLMCVPALLAHAPSPRRSPLRSWYSNENTGEVTQPKFSLVDSSDVHILHGHDISKGKLHNLRASRYSCLGSQGQKANGVKQQLQEGTSTGLSQCTMSARKTESSTCASNMSLLRAYTPESNYPSAGAVPAKHQ